METRRITRSLGSVEPQDGKHLAAGVTLDKRYLIQDIVGVGGMGAVYRARDLHFPKLVKLVAVKEMFIQTRDPKIRRTIVQNFEREANILATLHHPAIPRIFDYFTQGERSYLVMELITGKNLEEVINEREGFLLESQVIEWALEICDVLLYLHSHQPEPIIFRDIKPSNIMVNQHNRIMLIDFGIAKHFQVGQRGTQVGTEGYSPPEQYRGEASPLADIYALGATLHHLLTRQNPMLEAPFSFEERQIRKINPAVSVELEAVIRTALKYNPEERFKGAAALRESIITAAKRTGALSRMPFATAISETNPIEPIWVFRCEDEIRSTPTYHNGVLYIGCYDYNLYALDAASGEFVWKYPSKGGIVGKPTVMGNNVLVGSEDTYLHSVSTRSGNAVWTYKTGGPIRSSPKVAEGHVFVGSDDGYLHAVNALNGRKAWSLEIGTEVRSSPFVANDMVYVGCEGGDFLCVDFRGEIRWRFKSSRPITSSPIVQDDAVYFTSVDYQFYALDAMAGWVLWRYRMGKPSISSPVLVDNLVVFGSIDGNVYCLDNQTGKEKWRFKTDHQVTGSPAVYKDSIFVGSVDGFLYCLDFRTGRMRWKFGTEGPITNTPTVFGDIVYFGSNDNRIYAIQA